MASVTTFRNDDEAVAMANRTEYALGECDSGSVSRALALGNQLRTGLLHINDQTVADEPHVPFGGRGASGNARVSAALRTRRIHAVAVAYDQRQSCGVSVLTEFRFQRFAIIQLESRRLCRSINDFSLRASAAKRQPQVKSGSPGRRYRASSAGQLKGRPPTVAEVEDHTSPARSGWGQLLFVSKNGNVTKLLVDAGESDAVPFLQSAIFNPI